MATTNGVTAVVLAVFCLCSLAACAAAGRPVLSKRQVFVEGKVYCDPCRVQFQTRLSRPINGAVVELQCRSRVNETISYKAQAKTDVNGIYSVPVDADLAEEICELSTVSSPQEDCKERFDDFEKARVMITYDNGVATLARYANPLGFMAKEASPECKEVLQELFPEEETDD